MLLSVVVMTAGLVALPAPGIAAADPAAPPDFYSSFETGDPQPTWNDTVDTDAAGKETHAFFGTMTGQEWGETMYKHIDHHLQQFGL